MPLFIIICCKGSTMNCLLLLSIMPIEPHPYWVLRNTVAHPSVYDMLTNLNNRTS